MGCHSGVVVNSCLTFRIYKLFYFIELILQIFSRHLYSVELVSPHRRARRFQSGQIESDKLSSPRDDRLRVSPHPPAPLPLGGEETTVESSGESCKLAILNILFSLETQSKRLNRK